MPDYTKQPKGRFQPASPEREAGVFFNLSIYRQEIEAIVKDDKEFLRYYSNLNWMWKEAIKTSGVQQDWYFEENGYEYHYWAIYHSDTMRMETNMWAWCPNMVHHHLYQTCEVCGQHG